MNPEVRQTELQALKARVAELESETAVEQADPGRWVPTTYYTTYHILSGMVLGMIGATASLLLNVIGSIMVRQHPLELIRVYLTFPLGEKALGLDGGFTLAAGCCLYLGTGMVFGIPFHLVLSRFYGRASVSRRFAVTTAMALGLWVLNYYGLLLWLQPLLTNRLSGADGRPWIVELVPMYVAASTHLVFGWTMLLIDRWGRFVPPNQYRGMPDNHERADRNARAPTIPQG